jgi:hypothetical protein
MSLLHPRIATHVGGTTRSDKKENAIAIFAVSEIRVFCVPFDEGIVAYNHRS